MRDFLFMLLLCSITCIGMLLILFALNQVFPGDGKPIPIERPNVPAVVSIPVYADGGFKCYFVQINGHRYFVFPNATYIDLEEAKPCQEPTPR